MLCLELLLGVLQGVLKMYNGSGVGEEISQGEEDQIMVLQGGGTPTPGGGGPNPMSPHPDPNSSRGRKYYPVRNTFQESAPEPDDPSADSKKRKQSEPEKAHNPEESSVGESANIKRKNESYKPTTW